MANPPTHRLIWKHGADQSRAFHMSRIYGAIRAAADLLAAMRLVRAGVYEIDPAVVLRARHRVDLATPYLEQEDAV